MSPFKILITTTYWSSSGVSLRTDVVEFDNPQEARNAVVLVNRSDMKRMGVQREALALFEITP